MCYLRTERASERQPGMPQRAKMMRESFGLGLQQFRDNFFGGSSPPNPYAANLEPGE